MNARAKSSIPLGDWVSGWCIGPSVWNQNYGASGGGKFRTLKAPGDIAPAEIPASWSLHLGLTATPLLPQCVLLANGFQLSFDSGQRPAQISCLCPAASVLLIETTTPISPALFAAEYDVHRSDEAEWIVLPWGSVVLMKDDAATPTRYCLIAREQSHTVNLTAARAHLDTNIAHSLDQELSRRELILEKYHIAEVRQPLVLHAAESLAGHLRPPLGNFANRWSNADLNGNDRMDLNQIYPLVAAWCALDPIIAFEIFKTALSCQRPAGFLPAMATPEGYIDEQHAALPMFAQAALILKRTMDEPELLSPLIPKLWNYLSWAITYYDPDRTGDLTWHTSEEALIAETFDAEALSADLYALLLCEIDAMTALVEEDDRGSDDAILSARDSLANKLETHFWSDDAACYPDRFATGEPVERITLSSLVPLLWGDLDDRYAKPMMRKLDDTKAMRRKQGIALWTEWEDDPEPAAISPFHQMLMLHGLQQRSDQTQMRRLRQDVLKAATAQYALQSRIGEDISSGATAADTERPNSVSTPNAAALCVDMTCLPVSSSASKHLSSSVKWLDKHRRSVLVGAVSVLAIGVLAITIAYTLKKRPPMASVKANAALAQQYYSEGKYAEAIPVFEELLRGGTAKTVVQFQLGNAYLHEGNAATAETYYRAVSEERPGPIVSMNLALSLYRQGNEQEAARYYREVISEYARIRPDLAARAETALHLISQKQRQKGN